MADTNNIDDTKAPTTNEPVVDRKTAIEKAAGNLNEDGSVKDPVDEPIADDKKEDDKKPEDKKEPTQEEKDAEAELDRQGKQLIRALNDPAQREVVIDFFAKQAGYSKKEIASNDPDKVEEVKAGVIDFLKESLGEEFGVLADKLAPGVEKAVDKIVSERLKGIETTIHQQEERRLVQQAQVEEKKLAQDYFKEEELPKDVKDKMSEFMKTYPANESHTVETYLKTAFDYAVGTLGKARINKTKDQRINNTRANAGERLSSTNDRVPNSENLRNIEDSKPKSRRQSIELAAQELEKSMKG